MSDETVTITRQALRGTIPPIRWASIAALVLAAACLLSACRTFGPFPIDATPQNLQVQADQKLPLNVALVIPYPMGFQLVFDLQTPQKNGRKVQDIAGSWGSSDPVYPVGRELAKCSMDNFQQAFSSVTLLIDIPPPTEYDLTVKLRITQAQVRQILHPSSTTVRLSVLLHWKMSVLDGQNAEMITDQGIAQSPEEDVSGLSKKFDDEQIGRLTAGLLSLLSKDVSLKVFRAPPVRALALGAD